MQNPNPLRIAVVGGGISGLAAAFYLREHSPNAKISLFEQRDRLGGVLHTEIREGFEIEQSADNFITTVPYGLDLCRRLGLESDIVTTTPRHRQTFILWRGRLNKLPDGFMMMAPTKWWPMAITPLLTPFGKLRAAMEYIIPGRKDDVDESMEHFAVRRLGRQVFERLIEPLVSGVYAADMKKLSLLATLPRFREMEKKHGSLIRAMRANQAEVRKRAKAQKKKSEEVVQSGPRYNLFVTVKGGLSRIADEIQKRLDPTETHLATQVTALERLNDGKWNVTWKKNSSEEVQTREYDAVILAAESHSIAKIAQTAGLSRISELLAGIEHTGTVVVTAAFRREEVGHPLDGMGVVVPAAERNPILALSFSNEKYPHRAPEGTVLIRIFSGGARNPEMLTLPENKVKEILLQKASECLKISGKPIMTSISRWSNTMPQLHLGHLERIAELQKELEVFPTLGIAGNFLTAVGMPHCIHSGEEAAKKILRKF